MIPARPIDVAEQPAISGHWSTVESVLRFEPRFPLAADTRFRVTVDERALSDSGAQHVLELRTAAKDLTPATQVARIYPTASRLPENQLRFYIEFSRPMSRGDAYANVVLLDEKNKPVKDVFLELDEELWSPEMNRFTLLFDPGRIKSGLKPREDLGPTLENGHKYTLLIKKAWRDDEGRPLLTEHRKEFAVGPADNEPIDPAKWIVEPPGAGSREPLRITFPEALDYALLHRVLWVVNDRCERLEGTIQVDREETRWQFRPARPWAAGKYHLVAGVILEDLAANRIGRRFELDMLRPIPKKEEPETIRIAFDVRSQPRP